MAQLRTGILPLRIETGRWECPRITADELICQVCDSQDVEDEEHFIFHCQHFHNERINFLSTLDTDHDVFQNLSIEEKFCIIFDETNSKKTARFLVDISYKRKKHLFPDQE